LEKKPSDTEDGTLLTMCKGEVWNLVTVKKWSLEFYI